MVRVSVCHSAVLICCMVVCGRVCFFVLPLSLNRLWCRVAGVVLPENVVLLIEVIKG